MTSKRQPTGSFKTYRRLPSGDLRRVRKDGRLGAVVKARTNPKKSNSPAAATPDKDTPLLTARELREFRPIDPATGKTDDVDVAAIRKCLRMSQAAFARVFCLSVATVRDWELRRRQPEGPARVLLTVIAREPEAVRRALDR